MTDTPPRRWPPLSVFAAIGLLLQPAVAGLGYAQVCGWPASVMLTVASLVWLLFALDIAAALLRGRPAGFNGAVGLVLLPLIVAAGTLVQAGAPTGGPGTRWDPLLTRYAPPALGWMLATAAFLWWPATRGWCGRLPPTWDDLEDAP